MNEIAELQTPAIVVDLAVMERNLSRGAQYAASHGLDLRPHVKTHKSSVIGARQMQLGACGLTCATPTEVRVMSAVSSDILMAYPPVGWRAEAIASIPGTVRLTVALDSVAAASAIGRAASSAGRIVEVYVELDLGMHRVGLPALVDAIALAQALSRERSLAFAGIAFYPGHVREPVNDQDSKLRDLASSIHESIDAFARAGVPARVVSGGSTPTMWRSHEIGGITEIRPGTYVYNDVTTAFIGACGWDDCALTVAATVVSTAVAGQAVIDAGTKALGREPVRGAEDEGFGVVFEHTDVRVARMSEEHGVLDLSRSSWRPRIGDIVRVIPNHVCVAVHLADRAYGMRDDSIVESWTIDARGREQPA